jgi:hypothetical protein
MEGKKKFTESNLRNARGRFYTRIFVVAISSIPNANFLLDVYCSCAIFDFAYKSCKYLTNDINFIFS